VFTRMQEYTKYCVSHTVLETNHKPICIRQIVDFKDNVLMGYYYINTMNIYGAPYRDSQ
jgi:hypothetical protein